MKNRINVHVGVIDRPSLANFEFAISKKISLCKKDQVWCDLIGLKIINTCEVAVISS